MADGRRRLESQQVTRPRRTPLTIIRWSEAHIGEDRDMSPPPHTSALIHVWHSILQLEHTWHYEHMSKCRMHETFPYGVLQTDSFRAWGPFAGACQLDKQTLEPKHIACLLLDLLRRSRDGSMLTARPAQLHLSLRGCDLGLCREIEKSWWLWWRDRSSLADD